MTTDNSFQDVVQQLKQHMNNQWFGSKADGYDQMLDLMRNQMNMSDQHAHDALDAMIESGMVRYVTEQPDNPDTPAEMQEANDIGTAAIAMVPTAMASDRPAVPLAAGAFGGYWQIGSGSSADEELFGRKGQVRPS